MYAWIWRALPGPVWVRALMSLALATALILVLFEWVYPWLAPLLPFQQQTITE